MTDTIGCEIAREQAGLRNRAANWIRRAVQLSLAGRLLLLIVLLALANGAVAALGWQFLDRSVGQADAIGEAGAEALNADGLIRDLLTVNEAVFSVAAAPTDARISQAREKIDRTLAEFQKRLEEIVFVADSDQMPLLAEISRNADPYLAAMRDFLEVADRYRGAEHADRSDLIQAIQRAQPLAEATGAAVVAYVGSAWKKAARLREASARDGTAAKWLLAVVAVAAGLLMALLGYGGTRLLLSKPLRVSVRGLSAIARGELGHKVPYAGRRDEIGEIAAAMQGFAASQLAARKAEEEAQQKVRAGEAAQAAARRELAARVEERIGGVAAHLMEASGRLQDVVRELTEAVAETDLQTDTVAERSGAASMHAAAVAETTEQLAEAVREAAARLTGASDRVNAIADGAGATSVEIDRLVTVIEGIDGMVDRIAEVAEQTGLLALNAAIEAARSGAAGKGFAVVATEVKSLAAETKAMTADIRAQVALIKDTVDRSVGGARKIMAGVQSVSTETGELAAMVGDQSGAAIAICADVSAAASGAREISDHVARIRAAATSTGQTTARIAQASASLREQAGALQDEMQSILQGLRTG